MIITLFYYSTSDLQPSTAIVNQLPDQLVTTQIRTIGRSFKFIDSVQHEVGIDS